MSRTSFWPAKLLWLRQTAPRLFAAVDRWVSPAEFYAFGPVVSVFVASVSSRPWHGLHWHEPAPKEGV